MRDAVPETTVLAPTSWLPGAVPVARRLAQAMLILLGLVVGYVGFWAHDPLDLRHGFMIDVPFGRDFVNFWIGTRLVLAGEAAALIELPRYNALIAETFQHTARDTFVFSYPPTVLAPLVPLALLPYRLAVSLWTLVNLGAIGLSVRIIAGDVPLARWRPPAVIAVLSPAAVAMVVFGHFGGLLALGAIGAIRESGRRPWLAGLCLAALSVKPQLALVLGVILLLAGRWRCVIVSCLGAAGLVAVSVAAFGLEPWEHFLAWTLPYQSRLMADFNPKMLRTLTSLFFTSRFVMEAGPAWVIQGVVSLAAILGAARLARRDRVATPIDLFLILLAALVALPYANAYDLAIAAPALAVHLFDERSGWPPISLAIVWVMPPVVWLFSCLGYTYAAIPLAAALLLGLRDRLRPQPVAHDPAGLTAHRLAVVS